MKFQKGNCTNHPFLHFLIPNKILYFLKSTPTKFEENFYIEVEVKCTLEKKTNLSEKHFKI